MEEEIRVRNLTGVGEEKEEAEISEGAQSVERAEPRERDFRQDEEMHNL